MKNIKYFFSIILLCACSIGYSQLKPIGSWTDHLPYNVGVDIATDGELVYCGTTTGLFTYNTTDNSIAKFSKVNLLSDVEVSKLAYSDEHDVLVVAYSNANIDIIKNNRVINIPFIELSNEVKQINDIQLFGNIAYLSTAFGITLIDILKDEIVDTYKFGDNGSDININGAVLLNNAIYAASNAGIFTANTNSNLLDFNSWSKLPLYSNNQINTIFSVGSQLLVSVNFEALGVDSLFLFDGSTFNPVSGFIPEEFNSVTNSGQNVIYSTSSRTYMFDGTATLGDIYTIDNNNTVGYVVVGDMLYLLDSFNPLLPFRIENSVVVRESGAIRPNGPSDLTIFDLDVEQGVLWGVNGGHDNTFNNNFRFIRMYRYDGTEWRNFTRFASAEVNGVFDGVSVNANPNNVNQVYFGLWGRGLAEYTGQQNNLFKRYDHTNSEIRIRQALISDNWSGTGEGDFDEEGNYWFANTYSLNGLCVRKVDGTFRSFDLSNVYTGEETAVFDVLVDDNGFKWISLPKDNAIVVYDDNGTIDNLSDDRSILLTSEEGNGNVPGIRGIKLEKDRDGLIWIGTSDGIAVHFNPGGVFDGDRNFDRIIFFDGENNEIVLQNTAVTEIAVDGFNRKWIGTSSSGVLLLSEDGKETVQSFDIDNSPLISNTINAISIDNATGEVYFGTSKGIVSFRGEALNGSETFANVSVFPNPVRPEYEGNIVISGVLDNTTVKITDVNGTLINEIKSEGGQVLWDGNNFEGRRASTGVYLVLMSGQNETGDLQTEVGKIMFLK